MVWVLQLSQYIVTEMKAMPLCFVFISNSGAGMRMRMNTKMYDQLKYCAYFIQCAS